eukprot:GFUD01001673.1.p1 GENE.GFUD01001673.1~~GFUD01001673.1.p1  ORF type:complete len:783 (-),score=140.40 GFUD01001673.1:69-2417(-)
MSKSQNMIRLILTIGFVTFLNSLAVTRALEQIVAPDSLTKVRLPTIQLGDRSGIQIWAGRQESGESVVFEEGSGVDNLDNKGDQTKKDIAYFSTNFEGNLNTWSLDMNSRQSFSKSLCYNPDQNKAMITNKSFDISVAIFSNHEKYQYFSIKAVENQDFLLPIDQEIEFELSNQSSTVFQFDRGLDFIPKEENYLLTIESITNSKKCIHVGISDPSCPWNDDQRTVRNNKISARILSLGYFSIKAREFPNSFVIMLLPAEEDQSCFSTDNLVQNNEPKKMRMKITISPNSFSYPIIVSLISLAVPSLLSILVLSLFWTKIYKEQNPEEEKGESESATLDDKDGVKSGRSRQVFVPDLMGKYKVDKWHRKLRSSVYLYLILLVAPFYIVPSAQTVFLYHAGNSESCFFNYGCARPWGIFDSFNHIYSNVGYIWFGIVFLFLVKIKSRYFPEDHRVQHQSSEQGLPQQEQGLPQQYAVFYAMGCAMIFQGVLSCIFHVCPSNLSLQFDTTMMYFIMTLVFVKIYQFRHTDTTMSAYLCMFTLCLALIFEAFSIYFVKHAILKTIFFLVFSIVYIGVIFYLGINFYFNSDIKKSRQVRKNLQSFNINLEKTPPMEHKMRFTTSLMFVVFNVAVFVYVLISIGSRDRTLSTPFILLFGGNMFIYVAYYMVRKIIECVKKQPNDEEEVSICQPSSSVLIRCFSYTLFVISISLGMTAMYFYANKHQSRNMSPAESRERNQLCKFGEFFDNHDMWHFLSSTALFFAFLGLLTIDDDLLYVNRGGIKVF